jgi:hypothetical protein
MNKHWRAVACLLALCAVAGGPVTGASASAGSILKAFKSYDGRLKLAEGHLSSALAEYESSKDNAAVESAIGEVVVVLKGLDAKIARQSASSAKVKRGKAKMVDGLKAIITAYEHLEKAFAETTVSPSAATGEVKRAKSAVEVGRRQLDEGSKLLGA